MFPILFREFIYLRMRGHWYEQEEEEESDFSFSS